jgi:hypothetical protein
MRHTQVIGLALAALVAVSCKTFERGQVPLRSQVAVAAWAEPSRLPPRGGQVQILVRVRRPSGELYPGVQVRLRTDNGTLFSRGKPLVTDAQGMTRDRLTSKEAAEIIVQVGETRYRFKVAVAPRTN